jgi:hypothetical protein
MKITKGRLMAATLVAKPAFEEVRIELEAPDGDYVEDVGDDLAAEYAALVEQLLARAQPLTAAGVAPVHPPAEWFADPGLAKPTHLTITDDGRIFGHIASWYVDHIGMAFGTRPPRSRTGYRYFKTGILRTAEGDDVAVGQLTLVGGHAALSDSPQQAVRHYDDTASAFADVAVGEDSHGIWVAGALRPSVTPEQLRVARASSPSGDWRPINGNLELVAVCQVNVPGFPVVEARVASGHVTALVAAGAAPLVLQRLGRLEFAGAAELAEEALALRTRFRAPEVAALEAAALAAKARVVSDRFATLSAQPVTAGRRREYAKKGWALGDGSYPIADVADLKRAIQSYGRAKESDRAKVRRHIEKRARALGHPELIPEEWTKAAAMVALTAAIRSVRRRQDWDESKVSRDDVGRFRKIYYRLRQSPGAAQQEVRAALKALKAATEDPSRENVEGARRELDAAGASSTIDERTRVDIVKAAAAMAEMVHRFEVRGDDTIMSFDQLPTEIQDLLKRYMERTGLENRITEHMGPFLSGQVDRTVRDIVNFLERAIIDSHDYRRSARVSGQTSRE